MLFYDPYNRFRTRGVQSNAPLCLMVTIGPHTVVLFGPPKHEYQYDFLLISAVEYDSAPNRKGPPQNITLAINITSLLLWPFDAEKTFLHSFWLLPVNGTFYTSSH